MATNLQIKSEKSNSFRSKICFVYNKRNFSSSSAWNLKVYFYICTIIFVNSEINELKRKTVMNSQKDNLSMKQKMNDILLAISSADLSRIYFGKSSSWLYHKLNGIDGNGKPTSFSAEEAETLKGALVDLSDRIRRCADQI